MNPSASRRISRTQAFADQDVELAFPTRSWSGVRDYNGGVVFAMRSRDVQSCLDGFRCLLWSPVMESIAAPVDRPIQLERLGHCRLAAAFGGADGLLVLAPGSEVERGTVVALRVEKRLGEYWAFWGSAAVTAGARAAHHGGAVREPERLVA